MNVLEAARFLGVSRDTVYRLVKAERPSTHRKTQSSQSSSMIDRASLEAYDRARRPVNDKRRRCNADVSRCPM